MSRHFDTPSTTSPSMVFILSVLSLEMLVLAANPKPSLRRRRTDMVPLISP